MQSEVNEPIASNISLTFSPVFAEVSKKKAFSSSAYCLAASCVTSRRSARSTLLPASAMTVRRQSASISYVLKAVIEHELILGSACLCNSRIQVFALSNDACKAYQVVETAK